LAELPHKLTLVLVQGPGELGDGRGNLDPGQKNSLLTLEGDVFGPLDKPGEVSGGLDAVAHPEVAWPLLEQRVHLLLHLLCALFSLHSLRLCYTTTTIFVTTNNY